ncbi:hypothetical protein, partial [Vibrio mediterranei]|uniref:hypothetical protein n=1 Tax=Vibrio mediterranei TaxID=689 RepID=UPI00148BA216
MKFFFSLLLILILSSCSSFNHNEEIKNEAINIKILEATDNNGMLEEHLLSRLEEENISHDMKQFIYKKLVDFYINNGDISSAKFYIDKFDSIENVNIMSARVSLYYGDYDKSLMILNKNKPEILSASY